MTRKGRKFAFESLFKAIDNTAWQRTVGASALVESLNKGLLHERTVGSSALVELEIARRVRSIERAPSAGCRRCWPDGFTTILLLPVALPLG